MTPTPPPASASVPPTAGSLAERLAAITHDLLGAADGARHLVWTNPAWHALLGWTADELASRSYHELIHPDDLDRVRAAEREVLCGDAGERPETELRLRARDGSHRWFVFSTSYAPADALVYFSGKDITARKDGELSEARYKGLIANLPDSTVHLIDHDLRLVLSEGDRMREHGYDPAAIEGRLLADVVPPEAFARLAPEYRAALAGERRSLDWDSGDGRACYWVQIAPLRDEVGRVIGAMALSRDITERRAGERALEDRARDLERSNAELEQFAYIASHDLSEPLRMVSSYLQLLRRRYHGTLDADADAFIDYAVDGAARMRDLIDGLLTYSRVGRGERPAVAVDTSAVVTRVLDAVRAHEGARALHVELGELPRVYGDEQQLGQLFQNLIGNALKFIPEDREAELRIGAERDGSDWRFTVADNGIGLDPAHADRIFRMFQRLHTRDDYPGTGIGLAIAKKVVERHGGAIAAQPRSGGGTEFVFTLPDAGRAT